MSGLILKLSPQERVLVNGAVVENGDRRSRLNILTPNAKILRLRDAIRPEDANTPVKRVCYLLQLILSGDKDIKETKLKISTDLESLRHAFDETEAASSIIKATASIQKDDVYPALRALRSILHLEGEMLERNII